MLVPFSYNLRSIFVRRAATLLTVVGIGATVATVAGVLALQQGFQRIYAKAGRADVAVFMRPGATYEGDSVFSRNRGIELQKSLNEVARDENGQPLASMECFLAIRRFKVNGGETNVPIRGIQPNTLKIREGELQVDDGRWFEPGADEVVVGRKLVNRIQGCQIDEVITINLTPFRVVGILDGGGPAESEIWGDLDRMLTALERIGPNRVIAQLRDPADIEPIAARLKNDPRVPAKVESEQEYLTSKTEMLSGILVWLGRILGVIMGVAAVFTATNTMLSAVSARTHEVGILLSSGFRPVPIFLSFMAESLLLGLLGGRTRLPDGAALERHRDGYDQLPDVHRDRVRLSRHAEGSDHRGQLLLASRPLGRRAARVACGAADSDSGASGTMTRATLSDRELLERLIAFDTTSANSNLELAQFVADYVDRPDVRVERNVSPDRNKTNLVVRIGPPGNDAREGLTLSGHMDVVPAGARGWSSDPFTLTERDERLYARGSADMKGFLALAVNQLVEAEARDLSAPLALLFTYDEEVGTLGSKHFVETWDSVEPLPRRTIVGEPTSLDSIRLHKGHVKFRLTFQGLSAHSGYPHLGKNALEPAAHAVLALTRLGETLRAERPEHSDRFPAVPFVALNVAKLAGGVAINVVPETSVLDFGLRHLPGMTAEELETRIRGVLEPVLDGADYVLEQLGESPPMMAPPGSEFHGTLVELTGCHEAEGASFATDAGWLQTLGFECLLFGPGSIQVAHKPDEFLPLDEFARARTDLRQLIQRYCTP